MPGKIILITGAGGQIGTALTNALEASYGRDRLLATDIKPIAQTELCFEILDVLDESRMRDLVKQYNVGEIYHLAAILSAVGEKNPRKAWNINMNGLFNVLDTARDLGLKVFFPSSIAVFGSNTPRHHTAQHTIMEPETVYGISKVAGEHWCQYYHRKYGIDVRSVRYPGIIGYQSLPGGGTTDYAVEIFHKALAGETFSCFLKADTRLPMLYMPDAIRATLELMDAPSEAINIRTSYNLAGMSFTPAEIAEEIKRHIPDFQIEYAPDFRQDIANSWSDSVDDSQARKDWGWKPEFDLETMTEDMLINLKKKILTT